MMEKIRLGVVGLGSRGKGMFDLALRIDGVEAAALCDCNPEMLEPLREKYPQACFFEDFDEMLESGKIDTLLVETPAENHAKFCAAGLERGVNVFSDIPTVATIAEAEMLWQVARNSSAMFMCGANPNFWGFVEAMVDLHRQGMLGKPYYLEAEYIHDVRHLFEKTPWRKYIPPIKYCTHSLGPLLRILSEDLRTVSCISTGSQINKEPGQNDLMTAHFHTDSGIVVRLTISFINEAGCGLHSYRVFGTEGYFERMAERGKQPSRTVFRSKRLYGMQNTTELDVNYMRPEYANNAKAEGHGGADYAMFDRFFAALRNGEKVSPVSLREGLRMTLPGIYAAESAAAGGKLVTIRYPWDAMDENSPPQA
jgi:predicted dehydrogenase